MANLLNSSIQTHSGGLGAYWDGVVAANVTKDGYKCFSITNNTSNSYGDGFIATGATLTSGATYFVSGYIYVPSSRYFIVRQRDNTSGGGYDGTIITGNGAWQYFSYTFSCGSTMTNGQIEGFECDASGGNKHYSTSTVYYIRDLKLEPSKRNNILFTTKYHVLCNEFDETTTLSTHMPFTPSDGYTISAAELIESSSTTNIKYGSDKKFTCRELIEGDISDYISVPAPTLDWTTGVDSGTLKITNPSSMSVTAYYGTSSSSMTSTASISAGGNKSVSVTSNSTYYAYLKESEYGLSGSTASKNCKMTLKKPTIRTRGKTISFINNDKRTSVTPYIGGSSSGKTASANGGTASITRSTYGSFTAYSYNANYNSSSSVTGYILYAPSITYGTNTVKIKNPNSFKCYIDFNYDDYGYDGVSIGAGSTLTIHVTDDYIDECFLYDSSGEFSSSIMDIDISYDAPSTT